MGLILSLSIGLALTFSAELSAFNGLITLFPSLVFFSIEISFLGSILSLSIGSALLTFSPELSAFNGLVTLFPSLVFFSIEISFLGSILSLSIGSALLTFSPELSAFNGLVTLFPSLGFLLVPFFISMFSCIKLKGSIHHIIRKKSSYLLLFLINYISTILYQNYPNHPHKLVP